ncbi:MAG: PilN domain-containing protein [Acidimicrobiia bacterium]|nr:PilN domain-containing protein [Acidimicrobiia bacterium]
MRPINLLPPEQARAARQRRGSAFVVLLFVIFLVALGGLWFLRSQALVAAEDNVDDQRAANARLENDIAALSDAAAALDLYESRSSQIAESLVIDIDWGRFLNDLGRVLPPRTWVGTLAASAAPPADDAGDTPTYGSVTVTGTAFDYPDASTWFRTLDSTEWSAVGGAWVSSITQSEIGDFSTVDFSSSASLTTQALSNRSTTRIVEISE